MKRRFGMVIAAATTAVIGYVFGSARDASAVAGLVNQISPGDTIATSGELANHLVLWELSERKVVGATTFSLGVEGDKPVIRTTKHLLVDAAPSQPK